MAAYKTKYGGVDIELVMTDTQKGIQIYSMYNSFDDEYYGWLECPVNTPITDEVVENAINNIREGLFKE